MISCDLTSPDATCPRCGFRSKIRGAIRRCRRPVPRHCGPGCQLTKTFAWFGLRDDGRCGCAEMAAKMDAWGDECWQHLEEIVEHLRGAAANRGLPFLATAARIAVARAIEAAARERAAPAPPPPAGP